MERDRKVAGNASFAKTLGNAKSADWKRLFQITIREYRRTANTREDPPFIPSQILKGQVPYFPTRGDNQSSTPDNNTSSENQSMLTNRETFWDTAAQQQLNTPPAYPEAVEDLPALLLGAQEFLSPSRVLLAIKLLPDFYWVIFETRGSFSSPSGGPVESVDDMLAYMSTFYLNPLSVQQPEAEGSSTPKTKRSKGKEDPGAAIPTALQNKTFLLPPILNTAVILNVCPYHPPPKIKTQLLIKSNSFL